MEARNHRIVDPRTSLYVLQNLDWQRIRELGLHAHVDFYTSRVGFGSSAEDITAIYSGNVRAKGSQLEEVDLPQPTYRTHQGELPPNRFPGELLGGDQPGRLEFYIVADTAQDYMGLTAFINYKLQRLIDGGYDTHNVDHTSIMWVYLGNVPLEGSALRDRYVITSSASGLDIVRSEVDGIRVFTALDLERLMRLEPPKVTRIVRRPASSVDIPH